jgi:choline dehydrogenase-like flavoprotein
MCNLLVAPTSRSALKLRSSKPEDPPLLDPNILSNYLDLQLLYTVGILTIAIMEGTVGQKYGAQEYGIEETIRNDTSDSAMQKRLLKTGETLNHGSGTCSMGTVVDFECRVKGIEGLRVIDASVFSMPIGAHYHAAVYAVAEQVCARP